MKFYTVNMGRILHNDAYDNLVEEVSIFGEIGLEVRELATDIDNEGLAVLWNRLDETVTDMQYGRA